MEAERMAGQAVKSASARRQDSPSGPPPDLYREAEARAARHLELDRSHWRIENSCHWVLDVVFRKDQARARCGDAAQNLSSLRRIGLNLLKNDPVRPREPIRGKRIYAALDPSYLEAILALRQM